jgi:CheY-like chemotaxis protein
MLADVTPDLFILDIDMPETDGWTLARRLRQDGFRTTPVIMISGHAEDANAPNEKMSLCDSFLAKPYSLDDLVVRIADLLRLDLKFGGGPDEGSDVSISLSPENAQILKDLADIGHIRALKEELERFREDQVCAEELIDLLLSETANCNFGAIKRLLETGERGAA